MSTEKQLAANRRNAQLSTGPRTEAGKSRSRMNALKSGLYAESLVVCGEDSSALAQLSAEYHAQLHPVTPFERDLVDTIVYNQWLIRRLRLVEAQIWDYYYEAQTTDFEPGNSFHQRRRRHPLVGPFGNSLSHLTRLHSRLSSLERSTRRAFADLRLLQQSAPEIPVVPEVSETSAVAAAPAAPDSPGPNVVGFVPRSPDPPDAPGPWPPPPGPNVVGFVPRNPDLPDSPAPSPHRRPPYRGPGATL